MRTIIAFLLLLAVCVGARAGIINGHTVTIIHIDFSSGSDTTGDGSQGNPIKTQPYMPNFGGTYTHAAGDRFIFKGGVTWTSACYPWEPTAGGSGSTPDYYGVDVTWFSGGSFSRPAFDGGHTAAAIIFINQQNNFIFDTLNLHSITTPAFGDALLCGINCTNVVTTNCLLEDWLSGTGSDKQSGGWMFQYNGSFVINNMRILGCKIDNDVNGPTGNWNGLVVGNAGVVSNCTIGGNSDVVVFAQDVNHCLIYNIAYPYNGYDGAFHWNGFYMDNGAGNPNLSQGVPIYFRNCIISNSSSGGNMAYPNIEKEDCYIYNNVFCGTMSAQLAINIDPLQFSSIPGGATYSGGGNYTATGLTSGLQYYWSKNGNDTSCAGLTSSGVFVASGTTQVLVGTGSASVTATLWPYVGYSCYVWNNTISNYNNSSVAVHYSGRPGTISSNIVIQNNHVMGVSASITDAGSGNCLTFIQNSNLVQTPSQSTPFYSLATLYAPQTSGAPTVLAGANLRSLGVFGDDINGNLRPTTGNWDIGAYQFFFTPPPSTNSSLGITGAGQISLTGGGQIIVK